MITKIQEIYNNLVAKYNGGLSNTSTAKFDELKKYLCTELSLESDDLYITGSGTRPGNLEVRLSQGVQATAHTQLAVCFIVDEKDTEENRRKLTNSSFVTIRKSIGRGKASYDSILVIVVANSIVYPMGLLSINNSILEILKDKLSPMIVEVIDSENADDQKDDHDNETAMDINNSYQLIFFGSPGTGKSYKINSLLSKEPKNLQARFEKYLSESLSSESVRQYKGPNAILHPIIKEVYKKRYGKDIESIYSVTDKDVINTLYTDIVNLDKESTSPRGSERPYHNCFCAIGNYQKFIAQLPEAFRITFHPESDYSSFVGCYKPVMKEDGISYEFRPQAFTDAYVFAWTNPSIETYLIIEEINRGNCAAIFGDLFQLLDRKNGISEYPVKADYDLCKYLKDTLKGDASDGIKDGNLCLPNNLHIIATMNTSDQGLFPMDSAFKRRWDWEYVPVKKGDNEYRLKISGVTKDSWWGFLLAINSLIEKVTLSSDKKLGFWFVKPMNDTIEVKLFVNKVISYLWNDVFKNVDKKNKANAFRFSTTGDADFHSYDSFYDKESGEIDTQMVAYFINGVLNRYEASPIKTDEQQNTGN